MDGEKFDLENFPTSESAKQMLSYVTDGFYDNSYVGKWIFQVMGTEYDDARAILGDFLNQLFPETATWGLMYHEIKWQLPVRDNLSYEERRNLIFEKRDLRAPMNPYRMEIIVGGITGRKIHIDDESGPANTFVVEMEPGNNAVDMAAAIKKLQEIKQSHTTFIFRFTSRVYLEIGTAVEKYVARHIPTGTVPDTSTGMKIVDGFLEIMPDLQKIKSTIPLSGSSGNAGQYPKTSSGLKIADGRIEAQVTAGGYKMQYPETSEDLSAGSYPKTSAQAIYAESIVETQAVAEGQMVQSDEAGTKPIISTMLVLRPVKTDIEASGKGTGIDYTLTGETEAGTTPVTSSILVRRSAEAVVEASGEGMEVDSVPAGIQPKTSNGLQETGQSLIPEVSTESYLTKYRLCGDAFEI